MVWKSWGRRLLLSAVVLLFSGAAGGAAAGDVSLSLTSAPPRVSTSASAVFAFRAVQSSGWTCGDCAITCKVGKLHLVAAPALYVSFTILNAFRFSNVRAHLVGFNQRNPNTVPPTATVAAESAFTAAPNVSVLVSLSEPCPGGGGFTCNATYCDLIVYGPGRVEPSTLEAVEPGLRYSVAVSPSPDVDYGRMILVMRRGFCTDVAGHRFRRSSNSSFTLRFDKRSDSMNITASIPQKLLQIQGAMRVVEATNDDRELRIYMSFAEPVMNTSAEILAALTATGAVLTPTNRSTLGNRRFGFVVNKISSTAVVTVACDTSSVISRQGTPILAVDKLVSVQVAENTAQDVAGNPNLPSDRLQVRHYSVPASSSSIAIIATVIFAATAIVATLLTVSTSSLIASGAMARPSSYSISEPSRNLLRMACHIQIFALSRWLSINLPVEYYELAKGIEWTIPYIRLPWEGPSADPFVGYSTMPAIAYSELVDRSDVVQADPYYPGAAPGGQQQIMPMQIPVEGKPPAIPLQTPALDGKPLTAMEYRSFFEVTWISVFLLAFDFGLHALHLWMLNEYCMAEMQNQDMKPEAQIIMKLQDLDGWKYFGRNMLWLGVIGGGLMLLHLLLLLYLRLRYRGGTGKYGALVLPRFEIMLAILAIPCVSQASAALIRGGTTGGLAVGIVLIGILTAFLVALLLFLSLGITTGRLLQYKEVHQEGQEHRWYQEILFFMLLKKPFIKKRVQLVEIVAVASQVFVFVACLVLIDRNSGELEEVEESGGVGIAMLGVFSLAFAAQVCNEWNALYRQGGGAVAGWRGRHGSDGAGRGSEEFERAVVAWAAARDGQGELQQGRGGPVQQHRVQGEEEPELVGDVAVRGLQGQGGVEAQVQGAAQGFGGHLLQQVGKQARGSIMVGK
ncbi:hypothetical protein TRIUR3_28115 [Triticum urartu]|uniref:Bacterial Ig-like domain-containing protein n=1 Tax=Triticum urartu TaxID=4572 RepID=M7Y603_TRIUA|nr:hypothetical protein TRIUR3_28115 [Triticum urartu]